MGVIILEGVLFVALVAAVAALLVLAALRYTPVGLWLVQTRNRKAIERAAERRCPIHGDLDERELVRLPSGQRVCPRCFEEIVHGDHNQ
jgi:hypothetical protein